MRFVARGRKRAGISEVVGALLAIAITLIAGAGVFGFVNSQARVSELAYGNSVGNTNSYLAENFKVTDMYFATTSQIGVWIYNTGNIAFQPFSVRVFDCTSGSACGANINVLYNYTGTSNPDHVYDLRAGAAYYFSTCRLAGSSYETPKLSTSSTPIQNGVLLLLTIPGSVTNCPSYGKTWVSGTTYEITMTGYYGNVVTYFTVR